MSGFRLSCTSFGFASLTTGLLLLIATILSGCKETSQQRQTSEDSRPALNQNGSGPARSSEFTYSARITQLPQDAREVRVWLSIPQSDDNQEITQVEINVPYRYTMHTEHIYGNRMASFELHEDIPQEIPFELKFRVTRYEDRKEVDLEFPTGKAGQFLQPSRLGAIIPEVEEIATRIRDTRKDPLSQIYEAYSYVLGNMEYKKEGTGWGRGDTRWACNARYGNCSDYHALFIALAQALGVPATFEIGFPLPQDKKEGSIGGYHCWAHFFLGEKGWIPVDVSEGDKNPDKREYFFGAHDANRVKFTTGRDIRLVPRQKGEPLNFFIYPYVEVNGVTHEEMELEFSFRDL